MLAPEVRGAVRILLPLSETCTCAYHLVGRVRYKTCARVAHMRRRPLPTPLHWTADWFRSRSVYRAPAFFSPFTQQPHTQRPTYVLVCSVGSATAASMRTISPSQAQPARVCRRSVTEACRVPRRVPLRADKCPPDALFLFVAIGRFWCIMHTGTSVYPCAARTARSSIFMNAIPQNGNHTPTHPQTVNEVRWKDEKNNGGRRPRGRGRLHTIDYGESVLQWCTSQTFARRDPTA